MTTPLIENPPPGAMAADSPTTRESQLDSHKPSFHNSPAKWLLLLGIFFVVLGVYALSSPGRIDSVDGEARFDVSYSWLVTGRPIVRDPWIGPFFSQPGRDGLSYSFYGAPASVFAMPLVWLGNFTSAPNLQPIQFLFSLTTPIFGAAIAFILFLFYLELGVTVRHAIVWTMVSSFATLIWPASTSTLDNAQHAFFALVAVYLGFLAARRKSATYAVAGGLLAGVLILYQEYFLLIIPALALSTLNWDSGKLSDIPAATEPNQESLLERTISSVKGSFQAPIALVRHAWESPGKARSACFRYCLFLGAVSVGIALTLAYNDFRFGSWLNGGKFHPEAHGHPGLFGNPVAGFLTLLVSPGKSIFLYSPPLLLGLLGIGELWRRKPELVAAITATSVTLLLFLSCINFAGGDWCWGPRYLAPLLPLWALSFPFISRQKGGRKLVIAVVAAGFFVQLLGLSVENQRFFFEKSLGTFFWAVDPWVYFKLSALYSRVGEILSLAHGVPSTARVFNSLPIPRWTTYVSLGPTPDVPLSQTPVWIRNFQVYFLPRPWPFWMSYLKPSLRPVNLRLWLAGLSSMTILGAGLMYLGLKKVSADGRNFQP